MLLSYLLFLLVWNQPDGSAEAAEAGVERKQRICQWVSASEGSSSGNWHSGFEHHSFSLPRPIHFSGKSHGGPWGLHKDFGWALSRHLHEMAQGKSPKSDLLQFWSINSSWASKVIHKIVREVAQPIWRVRAWLGHYAWVLCDSLALVSTVSSSVTLCSFPIHLQMCFILHWNRGPQHWQTWESPMELLKHTNVQPLSRPIKSEGLGEGPCCWWCWQAFHVSLMCSQSKEPLD